MNLKTSGLKDPITAHGGCPVLVGSKWITNKWVKTKIKMMSMIKVMTMIKMMLTEAVDYHSLTLQIAMIMLR